MILPDDLRRSLEDHNKRARHFQGRADIQVVSNIPQEQWDYKTRNGICAIWYGMSLRVLNSEQARILSETPREYETAYSALESLAPTLNSQFGLAWQARNRTIAETHHRIGLYSTPNGWRDGTCKDGVEYPLLDNFELNTIPSRPGRTSSERSFIRIPISTEFIDEGYGDSEEEQGVGRKPTTTNTVDEDGGYGGSEDDSDSESVSRAGSGDSLGFIH